MGIAQVASEFHSLYSNCDQGKNEKERMEAISQMVLERVDRLIFLYSQENDPLVKMVGRGTISLLNFRKISFSRSFGG